MNHRSAVGTSKPQMTDALTLPPVTTRFEAYGAMAEDFCSAGIKKVQELLPAEGQLSRDAACYLSHGKERISDGRIIETLERMMERRKFPIRCLELGAGSSYGSNQEDYGAPWLARRIAGHFGSQVEVTVSDLVTANDCLGIYHTNHGYRFERFTFPPKSRITYPPFKDSGQFAPVAVKEFKKLIAGGEDYFQDKLTRLGLQARAGSGPAIILRPLLDPAIEGAFGLKVVHGVDYTKLPGTLRGRQYDFIFGRHLVPTAADAISPLKESINRLLAPGGRALLWFDRRFDAHSDSVLEWGN